MPADRAQETQGVEKVPKLILTPVQDIPASKLRKALCLKNDQQAKWFRLSEFMLLIKQQTAYVCVHAQSKPRKRKGTQTTIVCTIL